MGHISEEVKALRKLAKVQEKSVRVKKAVEKKAEYIEFDGCYAVRVKKGGVARKGYIINAYDRNALTKEYVERILLRYKQGVHKLHVYDRHCIYSGEWFVYLGTRPDPKWGEVSP